MYNMRRHSERERERERENMIKKVKRYSFWCLVLVLVLDFTVGEEWNGRKRWEKKRCCNCQEQEKEKNCTFFSVLDVQENDVVNN